MDNPDRRDNQGPVMHVKPCRPYHARTVRRQLCALPDGKSVFKLYFISIIGRDDPGRCEWEHAAISPEDFERDFIELGMEGVGFVTAFPHIVKVFRFAPSSETVLHVRAFHTTDLKPLDLGRQDSYVEFACYAEAAIAADEYHAWARAGSVAQYLEYASDFVDGPIADAAKMAAYWKAEGA